MNRSILIVICDFIVLSVLSLNTTIMVPHGGKFSGGMMLLDEHTSSQLIARLTLRNAELERRQRELKKARAHAKDRKLIDEQLRKISRELEESRMQLEMIKKNAKKRGLPSGELSELLDKEMKKYAEAQAKLLEATADLKHYRQKFENSLITMRKLQQRLQETTRLAEKQARQLSQTSSKLNEAQQKLGNTSSALQSTQAKLKSTQAILGEKEYTLQKIKTQIAKLENLSKENKIALSYTKGKLSATRQELMQAKSKLDQTRNRLFSTNMELINARKQMKEMKKYLDRAVSQLSSKEMALKEKMRKLAQLQRELDAQRSALAQTKTSLQNARENLRQTTSRLKEVERKLASDALKHYSQGTVKLSFSVSEDRFLMPDYRDRADWFTPVITIDGKNFVMGYFNAMTGITKNNSHARVTKLSYRVSMPDDKSGRGIALPGPILALNKDNRACMIELPPLPQWQIKPLKVITFSALKERGIDNLYLFKSGTFGNKSAKLDGRCSLNLERGRQYLYIRNSTRTTDASLKAACGDFVISKQGEFVGIVIAVKLSDFGKKSEAICFVFPDNFTLKQTQPIELKRDPQKGYYESFVRGVSRIREKLSNKQ